MALQDEYNNRVVNLEQELDDCLEPKTKSDDGNEKYWPNFWRDLSVLAFAVVLAMTINRQFGPIETLRTQISASSLFFDHWVNRQIPCNSRMNYDEFWFNCFAQRSSTVVVDSIPEFKLRAGDVIHWNFSIAARPQFADTKIRLRIGYQYDILFGGSWVLFSAELPSSLADMGKDHSIEYLLGQDVGIRHIANVTAIQKAAGIKMWPPIPSRPLRITIQEFVLLFGFGLVFLIFCKITIPKIREGL
jgi:hypothetical protein